MRRSLIIPLAFLIVVAPATAKEFAGGKLCGANGCRNLGAPTEQMLQGGTAAGMPDPSEPFLALRLRFRGQGHTRTARYVFLPRSGVVSGDGLSWSRPAALAALRRAGRHLKPFPASELPTAIEHDRSVPVPISANPLTNRRSSSGGSGQWWIAVLAGLLTLAAAAALVRRRGLWTQG